MPIEIINYNSEKFYAEMAKKIIPRKISIILSIFLCICSAIIFVAAAINQNIVALIAASVALVVAALSISRGTKNLFAVYRTNKVVLNYILSEKIEPYIYLKDKNTGAVSLMLCDSNQRPHWIELYFDVITSRNVQHPVIDFAENAVLVPETAVEENSDAE